MFGRWSKKQELFTPHPQLLSSSLIQGKGVFQFFKVVHNYFSSNLRSTTTTPSERAIAGLGKISE